MPLYMDLAKATRLTTRLLSTGHAHRSVGLIESKGSWNVSRWKLYDRNMPRQISYSPPRKRKQSDEEGQQPRLTHVNAAGEARMVDVGGKTPTRRVAVATAIVQFGTGRAAHDLIQDNTNRKGDVLGVARIAGIMAAKRTSDLIPLCHPLQLSKIVVDLALVQPHDADAHNNPHGGVRIQAHVECVGPTGVEMEALTAVLGAAATVVDMCKAVDKRIVIAAAKVVYKSGGKSGVLEDQEWVADSKMWMVQHGLATRE